MTNWISTKERDSMGKVTDFLIEQVKKQIAENHIVVWFDEERDKPQYTEVIRNLEIPGATIISYDGSFLKMRHEASPLMVNEHPPNLLLYVPMGEKDTQHALVGFTKTGVVMKPGQSPWQRNTRLAVIARQSLKGTLSESEISDIEKKIENDSLSLQDLDSIAENTSRVNTGTLALIYGSHTPSDITLQFLTNREKDPQIVEKTALSDLTLLLETEFGIKPRGTTPDECRGETARYMLLTAWSAELNGKIPPALKEVPRASQPAHIRACSTLAETWKRRSDLADTYITLSEKVENILGIAGMTFPFDAIQQSVTFRSIEEQIFDHIVMGIQQEGVQLDSFHTIVQERQDGFWATHDTILKTRWTLLLTLIAFFSLASSIEKELPKKDWGVEEIIQKYTEPDHPWCEIDTLSRRFEEQYDTINLGSNFHSDGLNALCLKARRYYMTVGNLLAQGYQKAIARQKGFPPTIHKQQEIFSEIVTPLIGEDRVAYMLVDAFRYEMAHDFLDILGDEFEISLQPAVGIIPSITELGMAALLPDAQKGVDLGRTGSGEITIRIGDNLLPDRKSRIKFFKEHCGAETIDLKIGDLFGTSKTLKEKIAKNNLALVTSQEIDLLGESVESGQFRSYISDIFSRLKRAIYNLERNGFNKFVITADHGFIFGEEIQSGMKIDPPGGDTIILKRRIWAGIGGARHDATLRFPAQQFGYNGEYDLVIPQGFAVFTVAGGGLTYMHGGLSPQEHIIPIMIVTAKGKAPATEAKIRWDVKISGRQEITTRTCMIVINGKIASIDPTPPKVRVEIRQEVTRISRPLIASTGYEEATGDIQLKLKEGKTDIEQVFVTLQITGTLKGNTASVHVIDAQTGAEYLKLTNIPVNISF